MIWTPSGRQLACEGFSEADPPRNGVYSIRASDGKGLTRITKNSGGGDIPLAYSPDGSQLLFDRTDSANHALFVTPTSGGQPRRITPWGLTDDYAGWSPDGQAIVFGTDGYLYRVSPEGRGLAKIPLKMARPATRLIGFDVSFSPDGQRIVDGSDQKRLTSGEDHHANWGPAPSS